MKIERNCTSKKIKREVAMIVFCLLLPELAVAAAADAAADSCVVETVKCL